MVRVTDIRMAVMASLSAIDGRGDYQHNLSTDGQVRAGVYDAPPSVPPFVAVQVEEVATVAGAPLSQRAWSLTLRIAGWTAGAPKHPSDRLGAAEDLLDDLRLAILSNTTLAELVLSLELVGAPFRPDDQRQAAPYGRVEMVVKVAWREDYR